MGNQDFQQTMDPTRIIVRLASTNSPHNPSVLWCCTHLYLVLSNYRRVEPLPTWEILVTNPKRQKIQANLQYASSGYNIQQSCGDLNPALRGGEANCDSAKILNDDANYGLATECLHRQQNSVDPKTGKSFEETQRCGVGMACPDAGQYNSGVKEVGQYFEKGSKGRFDGSAISASHPVQPH